MEIIKKYIYSIQRRLPMKSKDDIAEEIKSLIYDELEDKYGKKNEYTTEEIEAVLVAMGHPREVAARYRDGQQVLIGAELMPFYKMVLAIAAGGTSLGLIISFIVESVTKIATVSEGILRILGLVGTLFSALLSLFGAVTIVFALIQRFGKVCKNDIDIYSDWKPKDLPDLPIESERVKVGESIFAIVFIVIWAVVLNTYVAGNVNVGASFIMNAQSEVTLLPLFNMDVLRHMLPLWNISIGLSLVLQLVLLRQGKWQLGTRLFETMTSLFSILILGVLYKADMMISLDGIASVFGQQDWMNMVDKYYYVSIKVLIILSSIGVVVNVIKLIVKQARKANV